MMPAPLAVFLRLHAVGSVLLVLLGRVIAALALGAGQRDQGCYHFFLLKRKPARRPSYEEPPGSCHASNSQARARLTR